MNARTLTPELQRDAAVARVLRSKDQWTRCAVAVLKGDGTEEDVAAALEELTAARAALRMLDEGANEG
jgi:hypothetical protein